MDFVSAPEGSGCKGDTLDIFKYALESLRGGHQTVLMAVVDHQGSVPGKTGAMGIVSPFGLNGTIGGGLVEKELADRALSFDLEPEILRYDLTSPEIDSICLGIQDIAMLRLSHADIETIEEIDRTLEADGQGILRLSETGISFQANTSAPRSFESGGDSWCFRNTLGRLDTLYQIGGGHVALALSRIMATLGFRTVVMDDRLDLATLKANSWASETKLVDYADIVPHVPEGQHSWVTIMTQGHRMDAEVLAQLIDKDLKYLGMMGSANKVKEVFNNLENQGIQRTLLEKSYSPIGLNIHSHTPEEIAISVAAEIISVRNRA